MTELARIGEAIIDKQCYGGFVFIGKACDWPYMAGVRTDDMQRYDSMLLESIKFCQEYLRINTASLCLGEANSGPYFSGLPFDCFSFMDDRHFTCETAVPLTRYLHSLLVHACLRGPSWAKPPPGPRSFPIACGTSPGT